MSDAMELLKKAERALISAELLLKENDYEGSSSRSYYAMFYLAEALLLEKGLKFSSHKSVISLFGEHFVKTGIFKSDYGKNLSKAFEKRIMSDYSYTFHTDQGTAENLLTTAKDFVKTIAEYLFPSHDGV